jgi:Tfp pilus assembly protein PilE
MKNLIVAILFVGVTTLSFGQYVPKGKTTKAESALIRGNWTLPRQR